MKPWVLWVLVLMLCSIVFLAWLGVAARDGGDRLFALVARADEIARARDAIHGPAYRRCPRQQRLWGILRGAECDKCAANTRAWRAVRKEVPIPVKIVGIIPAAFVVLRQAWRRRANAAKADSVPPGSGSQGRKNT
ncbi:MAG: hypothetical protein V7607_5421 [Solirubrobacteraceae bacterium]